jgi:hypothetical protein
VKFIEIEYCVNAKPYVHSVIFDMDQIECLVSTGLDLEVGLKSGRALLFSQSKYSDSQLSTLKVLLLAHLEGQEYSTKEMVVIRVDPKEKKPS